MLGEMAIVPNGGTWKFLQRLPNGSYQTFAETDPDKLFNVVLDFRRINNLPTENLQSEISRGISSPVSSAEYTDGRSLRERVTAWLVNKQFGVIKYVTQEEANERAKLAVQDKYNILSYADSCLECYNSTLRGLVAIRQGRTTPYDNKLGACDFCGIDNLTSVHLQASCLPNTIGKPRPCWHGILDKPIDKELV